MAAIALVSVAAYYAEKMRQEPLKKQIRELEMQLAYAAVPMKTDTIRDSIIVQSQQIIEVDKTDYKKQLADKQLIKDLGLKLSQVISENKMLRETRDTVYLNPKGDSILRYHDQWAEFEYNISSQMLKYTVRDSFDTEVARIYKHKILWGLIKWGTKGLQVKYVNYNPNVKVRYSDYIMVKQQ